jgi:hypothetical protein
MVLVWIVMDCFVMHITVKRIPEYSWFPVPNTLLDSEAQLQSTKVL